MEAADLVFFDSEGEVAERVPGVLLHEGGPAWRPGAWCEFERDALAPLFEALEGMRREGRPVGVEVARRTGRYAIRGVDAPRRLLLLEGTEEGSAGARADDP